MTVTEEKIDPQNLSSKELKALAKARRPWYMKKRFWALGLVGLIIVGSAVGSGSSKDSDEPTAAQSGSVSQGETQSNAKLFPGRLDAQREDQERNIGEAAKLSGYTTTVNSAVFRQSVSELDKDGYVVVDYTVLNRDDRAQSYNPFDWKLQTPNGQVLDQAMVLADTLHSGELIPGGSVTGKAFFEVGAQKGDFYLIYKPDAFDAARGIWKVTV